MKKVIGLFLVFLSTLFVLPSTGFAEEHERGSWYLGFGLGTTPASPNFSLQGGGSGTVADFIGNSTSGGVNSINLKIGKTLSEHSLLGLDFTNFGAGGHPTVAGQVQSLSAGIANGFLMYTYFPYSEGLFYRLGGGYSRFNLGTQYGSYSVSGFGVLGGIGYAFWLGKAFNLTLNADYSLQQYSGSTGQPSSSNFLATYVGFDWY